MRHKAQISGSIQGQLIRQRLDRLVDGRDRLLFGMARANGRVRSNRRAARGERRWASAPACKISRNIISSAQLATTATQREMTPAAVTSATSSNTKPSEGGLVR
jgi:hypothetical protein